MNEINWRKFAKMNGLSPEQFTIEIAIACISTMSIKLDKNPEADAVRVSHGGYVLTVAKEQDNE